MHVLPIPNKKTCHHDYYYSWVNEAVGPSRDKLQFPTIENSKRTRCCYVSDGLRKSTCPSGWGSPLLYSTLYSLFCIAITNSRERHVACIFIANFVLFLFFFLNFFLLYIISISRTRSNCKAIIIDNPRAFNT